MANYLPATYQNGWSYGNTQPMYQSYGQGQNNMNPQQYSGMQQMSGTQGIVWVDGEAEAKGRQIPAGASQFAMWDINEPIIYIKSLNQMGMPMPIQKARYTLEKPKQMSGEENKPQENKGEYVTRDDFEQMKNELKELFAQNQQSKRGGRSDTNG